MLDLGTGSGSDLETGPALDVLTPPKNTWYQQATAVQADSSENYWSAVEAQCEECRYRGGLTSAHFAACQDGSMQPYFPDVLELQARHVDIEILARQLWDGINAQLFGQALEAERNGGRLSTVMKIGTVAEVNTWMEKIIARAQTAAAKRAREIV